MENLKIALVVIIMAVVVYVAGDAFFTLVGELYRLLDSYIWAFFAGIIAFFAAISIVVIMINIALWSVALIIYAIAAIMYAFD